MIYLGNSPVGIATVPIGWSFKTITVETACTNAEQVKTLIESAIGNSKQAMIYNDRDWTSMPTVDRQFLSGVLFDGFNESVWVRYNTGGSGGFQSNGSHGSNMYWTTTYDMKLAVGEVLVIYYKA